MKLRHTFYSSFWVAVAGLSLMTCRASLDTDEASNIATQLPILKRQENCLRAPSVNVLRYARSHLPLQRSHAPRYFASSQIKTQCFIDHRNEMTKTFQYRTGFCHTHTFAELWNSSLNSLMAVDVPSLSLQHWLLKSGSGLDEILENEVLYLQFLKQKFSNEILLGDDYISYEAIVITSQKGIISANLEHIQKHGGYFASRGPNLTLEEVETLTNKVFQARRYLLGLMIEHKIPSSEIKFYMRSIYQELLDRAWKSRDQPKEWAELNLLRELAQEFQIKEFPYFDSVANRRSFFHHLQKQPIGVNRLGHALTIVGFDPREKVLWIRDSASQENYYKRAVNEFMPDVRRYYFLTKKMP